MSSFGDGNNKTRIQEELQWIVENYYEDFDNNHEAQREFMLDVIDVLRYMCGEW